MEGVCFPVPRAYNRRASRAALVVLPPFEAFLTSFFGCLFDHQQASGKRADKPERTLEWSSVFSERAVWLKRGRALALESNGFEFQH